MLAAERRRYILDTLTRKGRVLATALSSDLDVSEDTIRRDLNELAGEGKLQRVHGGALPVSPAAISYATRRERFRPAKVDIAHEAASLIRDGQVAFVGGGTTNVEMARSLPLQLEATIVTHSPHVAVALAEHPQVEVLLVGGKLFKWAMVTVGEPAIDAIRAIRADLCFLGVCSLHPDLGITIPCLDESYVQRAMIQNAAEVIALASAEKLNTASTHIVAPLSELTQLVTNKDVDDEVLEPYRAQGMTIIRV